MEKEGITINPESPKKNRKEFQMKEDILKNLTDKFQPMTEVAVKSNLLYYKAKKLLNELYEENKVEKQMNKMMTFSYWRKK